MDEKDENSLVVCTEDAETLQMSSDERRKSVHSGPLLMYME